MNHQSAKKVPSSKISRLLNLGGLASNVVGNVIKDRVKDLSSGNSRSYNSLVMQPKNIQALADKLSHLRGAAMKLGQMISMDAGELIPPELSTLLQKLQNNATPMPHKQLITVLESELGKDWLDNFSHFDLRPFAAASIGQVHKAALVDGTPLAVKIQYPGVDQSIDSDVDNVSALIKFARLLPEDVNLEPILAEVKEQLKEEANYQQEIKHLLDFKNALQHHDEFHVPNVYKKVSSKHIIAMSYVDGITIDEIQSLSQPLRNKIVSDLLVLFFEELFEFRQMQSDPNFANYLYNAKDHQLVLLDFGATRTIPEHVSIGYQRLLSAALGSDKEAILNAAKDIGFFAEQISQDQVETVLDMFLLATSPLRHDGPFDFGNSTLAQKIKDMGLDLSFKQGYWHTPPVDAMFIHRKLAGLYLMAAKLKVQVDVKTLFAPYSQSQDSSLL